LTGAAQECTVTTSPHSPNYLDGKSGADFLEGKTGPILSAFNKATEDILNV
jgi:hypothetical protein